MTRRPVSIPKPALSTYQLKLIEAIINNIRSIHNTTRIRLTICNDKIVRTEEKGQSKLK